ncbi:MAG: diaminopimelate epimerase, partial [Desulfobacterales bacterium]
YRCDLTITLGDVAREVFFVNTGVPHAVIFMSEETVPVATWGRKVRFHELFGPEGTNVNFVWIQEDGSLRVRTYERGVEEETMACGTGVVASAIAATMKKQRQAPLAVHTSGGDVLTVSFDYDQDTAKVTNVYQQGVARRVFAGQLTAEALL